MILPTLRRSLARAPFAARAPITVTARPFSQNPIAFARKDTQHKDSLKPEPNEYSKSGSDDAAAAVEQAAFDPSQTRPEQEQASAEKESGGDTSPLDVSPANHEVSKPKNANEGKTGSTPGGDPSKSRETSNSGGSGAPKAGGGKHGA